MIYYTKLICSLAKEKKHGYGMIYYTKLICSLAKEKAMTLSITGSVGLQTDF